MITTAAFENSRKVTTVANERSLSNRKLMQVQNGGVWETPLCTPS